MGGSPTRMVLPILVGIALLGAAWPLVSSVAATSVKGENNRTPAAVAGGGTHEIVADPIRPLIYQVGWGDGVAYLNASTGAYIDSVIVGPFATSIDRSADGKFLYVAVSGANQTAVVDIDARRVVRTINLGFSPLSVRHGGPDRLFMSNRDNGSVQIVNETTGAVITTWFPLGSYQSSLDSLLDVSPNGSELFVHLLASPVWMFRYSVEGDNPVLLASTSDFLGQADQVIVDWAARIVYFSCSVPYGIRLISLDTLQALRDFRTDGYPAGIALLADQHLGFALNNFYPYRAGLWAFNTSTGELLRYVAIFDDLEFVVASPSRQIVLVWTPSGARAFSIAPSLMPSDPPPGAYVTYLPPAVSAVVWRGIPNVTVESAQVSVNSQPLFSRLVDPNLLIGYVSPPIRIGTWNITANIAWSNGSAIATWTITVDPPPPTATFLTRPQGPIYAGQPIVFDARYSSAQSGTIITYSWNFGDGSSATGPIVNATYGAPGSFVVTLEVATDVGQVDTEARTLVVETFSPGSLVPYSHPAGFRLPVPSTWSASENEPVGFSVVELVLRGPSYEGFQTSIAVDVHQDPDANETQTYLTARAGAIVEDLRRTRSNLVVTEPPSYRTIAGHAGIVFAVFDPTSYVAQRIAIVASEAHSRFWTIILALDAAFLPLYEPMFETMVDGFEITLAGANGASQPVSPIAIVAVGVGAAIASAVGVWWILRSRRPPRSKSP